MEVWGAALFPETEGNEGVTCKGRVAVIGQGKRSKGEERQ